jgi:hypothetical protein
MFIVFIACIFISMQLNAWSSIILKIHSNIHTLLPLKVNSGIKNLEPTTKNSTLWVTVLPDSAKRTHVFSAASHYESEADKTIWHTRLLNELT